MRVLGRPRICVFWFFWLRVGFFSGAGRDSESPKTRFGLERKSLTSLSGKETHVGCALLGCHLGSEDLKIHGSS